MTVAPARLADVTARTIASRPDSADLHTLRLALDLQVDAMLLTLGAAARSADDDHVPWRRWVVEDVDTARDLAHAISDAGVEPPATLASGRLGGAGDETLDDLIARYTAIEDLLVSVLEHPYAAQPWRPATHEALVRCRERLAELHEHRGAAAVRRGARHRQFLPGEMLG